MFIDVVKNISLKFNELPKVVIASCFTFYFYIARSKKKKKSTIGMLITHNGDSAVSMVMLFDSTNEKYVRRLSDASDWSAFSM